VRYQLAVIDAKAANKAILCMPFATCSHTVITCVLSFRSAMYAELYSRTVRDASLFYATEFMVTVSNQPN